MCVRVCVLVCACSVGYVCVCSYVTKKGGVIVWGRGGGRCERIARCA